MTFRPALLVILFNLLVAGLQSGQAFLDLGQRHLGRGQLVLLQLLPTSDSCSRIRAPPPSCDRAAAGPRARRLGLLMAAATGSPRWSMSCSSSRISVRLSGNFFVQALAALAVLADAANAGRHTCSARTSISCLPDSSARCPLWAICSRRSARSRSIPRSRRSRSATCSRSSRSSLLRDRMPVSAWCVPTVSVPSASSSSPCSVTKR